MKIMADWNVRYFHIFLVCVSIDFKFDGGV